VFHAKRRDVPSETNALSDTLTSRLMRAWPVPGATGPRTRNRAFDPGSWHIVDAHVADGGGLGPVRNGDVTGRQTKESGSASVTE